jgi:Lipid A 3-O-deacylase (PagL)
VNVLHRRVFSGLTLPEPVKALRLLLFISLFFGTSPFAQAQQTDSVVLPAHRPFSVSAAWQSAFIIAHTPKVKHLSRSHPTGAEVKLEWQTTGSEAWHAAWRFPKLGVRLAYYDFHNAILGKSFEVSPYVSKYIIRSARQQLHFRLGIGLAYFNNPFSVTENRKNTIVSTHVNAAVHFGFEYAVRANRWFDVQSALLFQHYSNGATSKPNFGINLPTLSAGLVWHQTRWVPPSAPRHLAPLPTDQRRWFFDLATSLGWRQWGVIDRKRYLVNGIHAQVGRRINLKNNLVAGFDYFYDRALLTQRIKDTTITGSPTVDVQKVGAVVGHELLLGRLAFHWHLGLYLYEPYKSATWYYERIGLKYLFTPKFFGAIDLKVHRGAADVIEWKVGARL